MSNYSTVELPPAAGDSPPQQPHPRHRRALWISLIAGLAALVLVVPLALFLVFRGGGGTTTATTNPGATASAPAATPGAPSAPGAPGAAQTVPQRGPAPDG